MNRVHGVLCSSVAFAALTGCGGGGEDTAPASGRHTQEEVKAVAQLGVLTAAGSGLQAELALGYLGGYLAAFSAGTGGSAPAVRASCATGGRGSGSFTVAVTKSAVRTGLAAGDQVVLTFSDCDGAGTGYIVNGTARLTAQGPIANVTLANYDILYEADMSGFSVRNSGGTATTFAGVVNANSKLTNSNRTSQTFTVPATRSFSTSNAGFTVIYRGGTRFVGTETTSPHSATIKLDGEVDASAAPSTLRLVIATSTELSGITASGRFVPSAGTIDTRAPGPDITASVRFSGSNATISADSNADGTLDLVFDTNWTALTTP